MSNSILSAEKVVKGSVKKENDKIPNKPKDLETNNLTDYIIKRKRNILTFVLLIILIKPIVHYFVFPTQEEFVNYDKKIISSEFSNGTAVLQNKELLEIYIKDSLGILVKVNGPSNFEYLITHLESKLYTKNGEVLINEYMDASAVKVSVENPGSGWPPTVDRILSSTISNVFYYPKEYRSADFATHLQNLFKDKLWIFGISFGIMLLLVFLFNDKIKAR